MKRLTLLLICILLLPAAAPCADAKPGKGDKCPVCGMFVSRYPDWLASITFKSGESAYFDGPKDLFTFYLNMEKYRKGKTRSDITAITVKDYYGLKSIAAEKAYFVSNSDVLGPMGKELVPFASAEAAASFSKDHQGSKPLRFKEITPAVLQRLQ
jgi:nitrous oxide reductase accessory protein NosL